MFRQLVQFSRDRWLDRPFVAPANIHWVKIDRRSGRRVYAGNPTEDPKSGIIWEAFKAETEVQRTSRQDDLAKQRDALIAQIRRGSQARSADSEGTDLADPQITADSTIAIQ